MQRTNARAGVEKGQQGVCTYVRTCTIRRTTLARFRRAENRLRKRKDRIADSCDDECAVRLSCRQPRPPLLGATTPGLCRACVLRGIPTMRRKSPSSSRSGENHCESQKSQRQKIKEQYSSISSCSNLFHQRADPPAVVQKQWLVLPTSSQPSTRSKYPLKNPEHPTPFLHSYTPHSLHTLRFFCILQSLTFALSHCAFALPRSRLSLPSPSTSRRC